MKKILFIGLCMVMALCSPDIVDPEIRRSDGATEQTPAYFDVPDFSSSWVYKVKKGGVEIAEICKEYINVPGIQAIVAYPVVDGKTDLTSGFVARVLMQRIPATETYPTPMSEEKYPAPTGAVHGGTVGFDREANAIAVGKPYTEGTSEPVTRIYIDSKGNMSGDPLEIATEAQVVPYTISDKRGDEREYLYSVVKIGTQYWLRENLKTTRYRDGSPITTNIASGNSNYGGPFQADPRNAEPRCAAYKFADANTLSATTTKELVGVLYTFPCISGCDFRDASGNIIMQFDEKNNLIEDKLSPEGWEVPAQSDFNKLLLYIGTTGNGNMRRIREIVDLDTGAQNNISGFEDENITGFSARSLGYRQQQSGNYSDSNMYYLTRTYNADFTDTSSNSYPAIKALNTNGIQDQSMMRAFTVRCLRKDDNSDVSGGAAIDGYKEGEIKVYQENTAKDASGQLLKPFNIVIVGDGFVESDYKYGGHFDQVADEMAEAFFSVEPYKTYRDHFRVRKIAAFSAERGASMGTIKVNTKFESALTGSNTYIGRNTNKVFDFVAEHTDDVKTYDEQNNTVIIMAVNIDYWAGTCYMGDYGRCVAALAVSRALPTNIQRLVVHEAGGHGGGQLADEYVRSKTPATADAAKQQTYLKLHQSHKYLNIAVSDDISKSPWSMFAGRPGYEDVGMYEGANNYDYGLWRCEPVSIMDASPGIYFNVASRHAIYERIMRVTGDTYSFETFLANDHQRKYVAPEGFKSSTKRKQASPSRPERGR